MDVRNPDRPTFTADREAENAQSDDRVASLLKNISEVKVLRITSNDSLVFKFDPNSDLQYADLSDLAKSIKKALGVKGVLFVPKDVDLEVVTVEKKE